MFLEGSNTTGAQNPVNEQDIVIGKKLSEVYSELGETMRAMVNPLNVLKNGFKGLTNIIEDVRTNSEGLNAAFVGNRERLQEMMRTITEAVPLVEKLGGSYKDAAETIAEIAAG